MKICRNDSCSDSKRPLSCTEIDEIVHLDAKSQLNSIVNRNASFLHKPELYSFSDVYLGVYYVSRSNAPNQLTLIVHCDGASLIRSSTGFSITRPSHRSILLLGLPATRISVSPVGNCSIGLRGLSDVLLLVSLILAFDSLRS